MTEYVVIGDGAAGTTTAQYIRKRDPDGRITIVSDDPNAAYYRASPRSGCRRSRPVQPSRRRSAIVCARRFASLARANSRSVYPPSASAVTRYPAIT